VEEVLLAGLGAVAITRDKAEEIADDLVERGKLTREDARGFVDDLVTSSRSNGRRLTERAAATLAGLFRDLGLATERQHAELELRVAQLEHRLRLLERGRREGTGSTIEP
jgi:polyhydroxyalkanoate synthesis regulator phasin